MRSLIEAGLRHREDEGSLWGTSWGEHDLGVQQILGRKETDLLRRRHW